MNYKIYKISQNLMWHNIMKSTKTQIGLQTHIFGFTIIEENTRLLNKLGNKTRIWWN